MGSNAFKQFQQQARAALRKLPREMGKAALLETSNNFRRQGYEDEAGLVHQWAPRKVERARTRNDGGRDRRFKHRALLVQSGRLRRSVRIVATTATSVTIGTDASQAEYLQEGTPHMPARPFLVASKTLKDKVRHLAEAKITACLK